MNLPSEGCAMQCPPTLNHTVADPGEGSGPPLFLDKTEARRAQNLFWRPVQPPPPYLRVGMTRPALILRSRSSTAIIEHYDQKLKKKDLYHFSTIPKLSYIFTSLSVARKPIQQYTTYEQSYVMVK